MYRYVLYNNLNDSICRLYNLQIQLCYKVQMTRKCHIHKSQTFQMAQQVIYIDIHTHESKEIQPLPFKRTTLK